MDNGSDSKFLKLLEKLLEPNFQITEMQLSLLSEHLPALCFEQAIGEDFFISWFTRFTETWKNFPQIITTKAILVICDVTGILCTEEQFFLSCNFTGILDELLKIIRSLSEMQVFPYAQLHYINLMTDFLKHKSGMQWLIATNSWYDIISITLKKTDKVVYKKGCAFVVELLDRSKNDNEIFHNNVVKMLITPLHNFDSLSSAENAMDSEETYLYMRERLNMLENILKEMFIKSCEEKDFKFLNTILNVFEINVILEELINSGQLNDLQLQFSKLQTLLLYFIYAKEVKEQNISDFGRMEQSHYLSARVYEILLKTSTTVKHYSAILELLHEGNLYFQQVRKNFSECKIEITDFQCQMLTFSIFAIGHTFREISGGDVPRSLDNDEFREQMITRFMRRLLPQTLLTVSRIRRQFTIQDALAAFHHIQVCSRYYEHNMVNGYARVMVYIFGDFLTFLQKRPDSLSDERQAYLTALLETLIYLFTEFDLSWKDSLEATYVTDKVGRLLKQPNLTPKVTTRGLQLLNVATRKNLSPEMFLLVDDLPVEKIPYLRAHFSIFLDEPSWEIRNAALHVIHARVQTKKEYNSTKTVMLELNYPELILNMMISDPEDIVRISAFRCIRDIITVKEFWDNLTRIPDFFDKMMHRYYLETEEVLRGEAILLLVAIYEHQKLPAEILEKFYNIMSQVVLQDECSSIKTNALSFWKIVIDNHLSEEGVIDGEFPSATFSRKLKKIITFDAHVIKKCLERVLCKLSEIRCLTAFLFALNCQPRSVEETAVDLVKPFMDLLKTHFFTPPDTQSSNGNLTYGSFASPTDSDYSTGSSNIFSPYPESLYDDILEMQEPLTTYPDIIDEILMDSNMVNPVMDQRDEFVKFVENFDFSAYKRTELNDRDVLLNNILG